MPTQTQLVKAVDWSTPNLERLAGWTDGDGDEDDEVSGFTKATTVPATAAKQVRACVSALAIEARPWFDFGSRG